ncbi:alkaline serine protease [Gracilibacillus boraciitolerans JCM 21714]|uniref:Alkaline serine protease n=1 Tax=Gracilibacillus boraciitolerans JCM 21714 TaxID=1298598 RepID=W4VQK0_9BACI|nr:S8 family serine peptidase [Gracilibacillus boraciitolerans]GAE95163.1 alkaline serine protease [Gracilibacillus boraciitolerans JCM 21714]
MKKTIWFTILIYLVIGVHTIFAEDLDEERIIIGFEDKIDLSLLNGINYQLHHRLDNINAIAISIESKMLDELETNNEIAWIEQDIVMESDVQIMNTGNMLIGSTHINALNMTGKGVKVGIIDTGISSTHPDLKVQGGVSFVEGVSSFEDDNGHGTHVAGIIAAQNNDFGVLGIAPEAHIYAIKSLNNEGEGRQADVIAGIEWAIEKELDIVNLSITTPQPTNALELTMRNAYQAGLIIIAASGNDKEGNGQITDDILYPAKYPYVIGVGSVDENLKKSEFSYQGHSIELVAPGEEILSTFLPNKEAYLLMSGTSMATPFVTAVTALYKQVFPQFDNDRLRELVVNNAMDLGVAGRDSVYGYGLVQPPPSWFLDVEPSKWYTDSINFLRAEQFVAGYPEGIFEPEKKISRGEVATMIGRILDVEEVFEDSSFSDVNTNYYASGYINALAKLEIIKGYPDQTYRPKEEISRAAATVIIQRAFDLYVESPAYFTDVQNDKKYYFDAINDLKQLGVVKGYLDRSYKPENLIQRAELSSILAGVLQKQ